MSAFWGKSGHDPFALLTKVTIPCSNELQGWELRAGHLIGANGGVAWLLFFWSRTRTKYAFSLSLFCKRQGTPPYLPGPLNKHSLSSPHQSPVDLLFIDLNLKGETEAGLSLAAKAVEMRPELKVLYTSGQAVTDGMAALFVKDSAFLPKPYTVEQLGTMLGIKFNFRSSARPHVGDGDGNKMR